MTAVAAWVVEGLLLDCSRGIVCIAFTAQGAESETVDGHAAVLIVHLRHLKRRSFVSAMRHQPGFCCVRA